jgi:hypothetical protein
LSLQSLYEIDLGDLVLVLICRIRALSLKLARVLEGPALRNITMAKVKTKSISSRKRKSAKEEEVFVKSLRANKQIVRTGTPLSPGATHEESKNPTGKSIIIRRRFSAV